MTLGELRNEILTLNWENEDSFDGDDQLLYFAVNRAVSIISSEVRPILGELVIVQNKQELPKTNGATVSTGFVVSRYIRYNLGELSMEGNVSRFRSVAGVYWENENGLPPKDGFRLEGDNILCIPASYIGEVRVIYKRGYTPVSISTGAEFRIELEEEVCVLVPLLAAYFVWLDDDRSRAQEYYNQYELRRERLVGGRRCLAASVVVSRECRGL